MSKKYPLIEEARSASILLIAFGFLLIFVPMLLSIASGGMTGMRLIPFFGPLLSGTLLITPTIYTVFRVVLVELLPYFLLILGFSLLAKTESEVK